MSDSSYSSQDSQSPLTGRKYKRSSVSLRHISRVLSMDDGLIHSPSKEDLNLSGRNSIESTDSRHSASSATNNSNNNNNNNNLSSHNSNRSSKEYINPNNNNNNNNNDNDNSESTSQDGGSGPSSPTNSPKKDKSKRNTSSLFGRLTLRKIEREKTKLALREEEEKYKTIDLGKPSTNPSPPPSIEITRSTSSTTSPPELPKDGPPPLLHNSPIKRGASLTALFANSFRSKDKETPSKEDKLLNKNNSNSSNSNDSNTTLEESSNPTSPTRDRSKTTSSEKPPKKGKE